MLRLTYDDNGTSHDDITLQVGDFVSVSDSYYLLQCMDEEIPPQIRTRTCLAQMMAAWAKGVFESVSEVYLLAELHDEFTRWIRCDRNNDEFSVQLGWSTEAGHDLPPVRSAVRKEPPADWQECDNSEPFKLSLQELLSFGSSMETLHAQEIPNYDPTPIFEHFRGAYGTQLLTAAVAHFDLFGKLSLSPDLFLPVEQLRKELELHPRPFNVLVTALKSMDLLVQDGETIGATPQAAEHLLHDGEFAVTNYIGLAATSPDVIGMVERLKTNTPYGLETDDNGAAFIYRDGMASAMEQSELARHFTLSLAGRAKNVAPVLTDRYRLPEAKTLLDIGGGSGIYAIAYLARNHHLKAIVMDRPEVLTIAAEFAEQYGVTDRVELLEGDMFADEFPTADVMLLSNILHDWDIPECQELINKCSAKLPKQGQLLIHDVFLNDAHDGPLPIALYSAALFTLTEGRAYSVKEYSDWMKTAGLTVTGPVETMVHCGVLCGVKQS